ncbi:MAG: stage V sporulation protein AD [Clostridia bacterium]|nr:stage V sporulation protein AD [Clostridia bacterium]
MKNRIIPLKNPAYFISHAAVGGHEEGKGPLGRCFDLIEPDDKFGMDTWEHAEGEIGRLALGFALKKAGLASMDLRFLFAGDLQNQCVASSGGLYTFGIPYIGLYGACSTCTEALMCLSVFLSESGGESIGAAVTTSHNCAAERQFRTPIEYGGQRSPTAQWTATGGGAISLSARKRESIVPAAITAVMPSKVIDGAISDATNMGAAMAPAAAESILHYFAESCEDISSFDAIVTGDLGRVGSELLLSLLSEGGIDISKIHFDCGNLLYDFDLQDVHSGGSGCGCSASVLSAFFVPKLFSGEYKRLLFLSTGALMSPSSVQQGDHIFGVAPAIKIERTDLC